MKVPDKVFIQGAEYKVVFKPDINDGTNVLAGQISYDEGTIEINSCLKSTDRQCITFLHEILHGIREAAGLEIENEEKVVEVYSRGLLCLLKENPELFVEVEDGNT